MCVLFISMHVYSISIGAAAYFTADEIRWSACYLRELEFFPLHFNLFWIAMMVREGVIASYYINAG